MPMPEQTSGQSQSVANVLDESTSSRFNLPDEREVLPGRREVWETHKLRDGSLANIALSVRKPLRDMISPELRQEAAHTTSLRHEGWLDEHYSPSYSVNEKGELEIAQNASNMRDAIRKVASNRFLRPILGPTMMATFVAACSVSANPNPNPQTFSPSQSPETASPTLEPTVTPETPRPSPTITASPEVSPTPTLPIVEGLTPEQVQDLQDWLDRKTPSPLRFNGENGQIRFGLLPENPNSSPRDKKFTGQFLATKELSAGNAIIFFGVEDNSGKRWFIPFEAKNKSSVAYDTLSSLNPTANNGDLKFIKYPEYYSKFDEVFKGKIGSIILPVDSFPDYEPWTQLCNFAKEAQMGNINDISNWPSFINDMGATEGPAIGQINVYNPPSN